MDGQIAIRLRFVIVDDNKTGKKLCVISEN